MKFTPDTPLVDIVAQYIADRATDRAGQPLKKNYVAALHRLIKLYRWFLKREPVAADLNPVNLPAFEEWLRTGISVAGGHVVDQFQTLCRYIGSIDSGTGTYKRKHRPTRILSEAPGTLWHLCISRYFNARASIRSKDTTKQYKTALADFREYLGHDPTPADLDDEKIVGMMKHMLTKGVGERTANEKRGRIVALWNWMARKRLIQEFPDVQKLPEPHRTPRAWSLEQLGRLFEACKSAPGELARGVKACDWFPALHLVLWDSGERIGAILACRWEWLDPVTGLLEVPYTVRKRRTGDKTYQLRPETIAAVEVMRPAGYEMIFPREIDKGYVYRMYGEILKAAGLPADRKSKFHRMRKSVASHMFARGGDACSALGHSSQQVTQECYLDPAIVGVAGPSSVLPALGNHEHRIEVIELPKLTYRQAAAEIAPELAWL